jgi:DNA-binding beta-propeller fold protein YncE
VSSADVTRCTGVRCAVILLGALLLAVTVLPTTAGPGPGPTGVPLDAYANFEGAQTSPIRLAPSGTRLFAVNTGDARVSVFDVSQPSSPRLVAEIPVGLEPVSVNARTDDEAWVVNQVSNSISIVSVSRGMVVDTVQVKAEPADLVFVGERAFVTVSRSNEVRVFDVASHAQVASITLRGENPRALAASPDGRKVYVAFALSGNGTTIIPAASAPPPPAPTDPSLPPAPQQGLIVDAADRAWQSAIPYTLLDNDVAEIDTNALTVSRYFGGVGTINLGLAVRPTNGDVFVANTDARNRTRFEPNLRGHFVDNRVTRIAVSDGSVEAFDLNPSIDYGVLPNPAARATTLAQPTALVFEPDGAGLYVAAFGTDRVARLDANGDVTDRIEVGPTTAAGAAVDPRHKHGPRGLALNPSRPYLYVLNRIANTISVVDTAATPRTVVTETAVGSFDPTPEIVRNGRGFLYDAKLSGNGTVACAACHVDADMDFLGWDLGDPAGGMETTNQGLVHPMKGPMMTQTLRGLDGLEPFHWRGDRQDFLAFNRAFDSLMGGAQLSDVDMAAFQDFIRTVRFLPNPNQNLDRTLPASVAGGDPNAGRSLFLYSEFRLGFPCNDCHLASPGPGTRRGLFSSTALEEPQQFKAPQLRNLYQKTTRDQDADGTRLRGFGLSHDGSFASVMDFLSQPTFGRLATDPVGQANLNAFLQTFDTGTPPAVGYTRTIGPANLDDPDAGRDWRLLESQADAGNIDLIAKGTIDGQLRGLVYRPSMAAYQSDRTGVGPFYRIDLRAKIEAGDTLTLMGVPPRSGERMGIDRDLDGRLDGD